MRRVKVLFDHETPFVLAHGGFQIQIEQTMAAVRANGVDADWMRWWQEDQQPELIHFFGRPTPGYAELARNKGIKMVFAPLLTGVGSRSPARLLAQKVVFKVVRRFAPPGLKFRLNWDLFMRSEAVVALTPFEAKLMRTIYATPADRLHVAPNGVEDAFLKSEPAERGKWLVCTAVITERKRVVELAQSAIAAKTPVWVIGTPYAESDPYAQKFIDIAKGHSEFVRYEGGIRDRAKLARIYREARGFVLLSDRETLSLSALEASACECPLLLTDLPWARTTFGAMASYCPLTGVSATAQTLRQFYDQAPGLPTPPKPKSWLEIGAEFKKIYERALSNSR